MHKYVFFIGGSGARVYRALLHSAAAGILKSDAVSVMLIDADESNSANTGSVRLYREYRKVYNVLQAEEREIFTCDIEMVSESILSPVSSDTRNLELAVGFSSDDRRRMLRCLYTQEEIEQDLKGGFYAHPNIGCVFFSTFSHEEFTGCLHKMEIQLNNGEDISVALVGSIFGGTGAAGIPTIYKLINEKLQGNIHKEKLKIGGIFIEPYFKVNGKKAEDNKNITIDMDDFFYNTYEALSYYKTNQNMDFDSIYLLGQQMLDIVNNEYVDSGDGQNNKAHIVELYAALAIDSFFNGNGEKGVYGCVCRGKIDWGSFPKAGGTGPGESPVPVLGLADFARTQAIYMAEICEYVERVRGSFRDHWGVMVPQWYNAYHMNRTEETEGLEILKEYSVLFMEWLYMINSTYDASGSLVPDGRIKLFGSTLEDAYRISQEMRTQSGKNIKENLDNLLDHFNTFVDTASNIEYVLEKVLLIMSMAGIVSGNAVGAGVGAAALFFKIFALASRHKGK